MTTETPNPPQRRFPELHLVDDTGRKILKTVGGDGTSGGMEQRVGKLEFQMERVLEDTASLKSDMQSVREQLARIDAKLDSKVDYKWMTAYVLGIIAVVLREEIISYFTG